jgi:hypothetical protein
LNYNWSNCDSWNGFVHTATIFCKWLNPVFEQSHCKAQNKFEEIFDQSGLNELSFSRPGVW